MKSSFNPMTNKRTVPSLTKGEDVGKGQKVRKSKGGAGKEMGPAIGKGYLVSGKGNVKGTGGGFGKVIKAKKTRGTTKGK